MKIEIVTKAVLPEPVAIDKLCIGSIYTHDAQAFFSSVEADTGYAVGMFFIPLSYEEHAHVGDTTVEPVTVVTGLSIAMLGTPGDIVIHTVQYEVSDKTTYYLCEHMKITLTF